MSAALIWKRCKLDDEVNKLTKNPMSELSKYVCNNAKNVLNDTNCFNNDIYSLPPGVDSKVRELYPLLHQIQSESRGLSDYDLEKMAHKINFTDNPHYDEPVTKYLGSCDAPFNHTYFPDYNIPSTHNTHYDKSYEKLFDLEYKTPASVYRQSTKPFKHYDTSYGLSLDRRPSMGGYFPSTNIFNNSTCRSQLNTPGYLDINRFVDTSNFLSTPNNLNFKGMGENTFVNKNSYDKESTNVKNDFDYKNEFLTAFQPGNEYRNDYTTVETPVAESSRRNPVYNEEFVSSFPWERNLSNQFNPNANPDYFNIVNSGDNLHSYDGLNTRRNDLWSDVKTFGNFNPNSPLGSMLNEDLNYNYRPVVTPRRPYY